MWLSFFKNDINVYLDGSSNQDLWFSNSSSNDNGSEPYFYFLNYKYFIRWYKYCNIFIYLLNIVFLYLASSYDILEQILLSMVLRICFHIQFYSIFFILVCFEFIPFLICIILYIKYFICIYKVYFIRNWGLNKNNILI